MCGFRMVEFPASIFCSPSKFSSTTLQRSHFSTIVIILIWMCAPVMFRMIWNIGHLGLKKLITGARKKNIVLMISNSSWNMSNLGSTAQIWSKIQKKIKYIKKAQNNKIAIYCRLGLIEHCRTAYGTELICHSCGSYSAEFIMDICMCHIRFFILVQ